MMTSQGNGYGTQSIPCVFPDRDFLGLFSLFSGYSDSKNAYRSTRVKK